jgi:uncharacterized membrane protein
MVFLPATPVPATGQNLLIPEADIEDINLSVEDMTKIVLSLGSLAPEIIGDRLQVTGDSKRP